MTAVQDLRPTLAHLRLSEPTLVFDPTDTTQRHVNPLIGLARFGPYSAARWEASRQRVRVAILAPSDSIDPVRDLLNGLREPATPQERKEYMPAYAGFRQTFRSPLIPADPPARMSLPDDLDNQLSTSTEPHRTLAR